MMSPDLVKARVIDIRSSQMKHPNKIVVDANILYFIYSNYSNLVAAGGRLPAYQYQVYPKWWAMAISKSVLICTASVCLAEFAHIAERAELEVLWRTDVTKPELDLNKPGTDYSHKYIKTVRYHYQNHLESIRSEIGIRVQSIQKSVEVLPQVDVGFAGLTAAAKEWKNSTSDFNDSILIATAKRAGLPQILSDDADLVSFEGITLYTANNQAINAAAQANKVIR